MSGMVTVPILPSSLCREALLRNHDAPTAGHQGLRKTLERLRREAYWVSMARDVEKHCRECTKCQQAKLPTPQRAPLMNMPIGQPWQMVAVDILKVPLSTNNNPYLLVIQDYFTKWADAIPIPDQTATRITEELIKLFSVYGQPAILHSDQGRNFESAILAQVLDAFGVHKTRTTAYHPQGDGMVERFNRSLLQLLRAYVDSQNDWERYLPLVLYAYRTSVHSSTGASPFVLMYGRDPTPVPFSTQAAFDPVSFPAHLQAKLAEMHDFVEANLAQAAHHQKRFYDRHSSNPTFRVGDHVWLSVPTAGKLDPRWEGGWVVKAVWNPLTIEIVKGESSKVVHSNRLQPSIIPGQDEVDNTEQKQNCTPPSQQWDSPTIEHTYLPPLPTPAHVPRRYPQRQRRAPNRYGSEA